MSSDGALQADLLSESDLAVQACASCRKQKRRCDKQLPSCSLCVRIGRPCDYSADSQPHAPLPEDFAALRQQVADLQELVKCGNFGNGSNESGGSNGSSSGYSNGQPLPRSSDESGPATALSSGAPPVWPGPSAFPSLFFLDSIAFEYGRFQIQPPHVRVPPGALTALGSSAQLREMIEHYFVTVHTYFPVVSKIRMYQHLANPLHEPGADIALLFLAMKLACSEVPEGMPPQTQLYLDVKSFYHYVEVHNGFSIQMIQALLLIGLYEMGQAIYPAAYLTIGNCARIGHAAGLHTRHSPQMLPQTETWTEQEERRRLWWGIVIMDRFINIGHRGKPFATSDPVICTHLPTDDSSWDRGQMVVTAPLCLSASQTIRVTSFARTCQAAHLLGKILRHIDSSPPEDDFHYSEALQLHRTMRALADVLPGDFTDEILQLSLCTSMSICYSALLTLYDSYSCTSRAPEQAFESKFTMQRESIDGLREISGKAAELARHVRDIVGKEGLSRLSPMVVDCVYQAAANYAWYVRESSDRACSEQLQELKELLLMLDRRWKVAGEYYRTIEATELQLKASFS